MPAAPRKKTAQLVIETASKNADIQWTTQLPKRRTTYADNRNFRTNAQVLQTSRPHGLPPGGSGVANTLGQSPLPQRPLEPGSPSILLQFRLNLSNHTQVRH